MCADVNKSVPDFLRKIFRKGDVPRRKEMGGLLVRWGSFVGRRVGERGG